MKFDRALWALLIPTPGPLESAEYWLSYQVSDEKRNSACEEKFTTVLHHHIMPQPSGGYAF